MGMFDSVMIPCPKCGGQQEAQSKSGPCLLGFFPLESAPSDVMEDVNRHAPFTCSACGAQFKVVVSERATVSLDGKHRSKPALFMHGTGDHSLYFLDTEFDEDGKTINLLSIGITDDQGRNFYAVNSEADHNRCNDWVKKNVLPHLGTSLPSPYLPDAPSHTRKEIAAGIIKMLEDRFAQDHKMPLFYGYFADYDWVILCQLYGRMVDLPNLFPHFCMDLRQTALMLGIKKNQYPKQGTIEHNALNDAQWNWQLYQFLFLVGGAQ